MMKLKMIEMGPSYRHGFDPGARAGIKCVVEVQLGERAYETTKIELPNCAVRRIVELAIAETEAIMSIDRETVDVEGAPGTPCPVEEAEMPLTKPELAQAA